MKKKKYLEFCLPPLSMKSEKIILHSHSRPCELDPLLTHLLEQCLDILAFSIWNILSMLLAESKVLSAFKEAVMRTLIETKPL